MIPVDESNMVQRADVWRQSPMDAKYLFINQGGHCQEVKDSTAIAPSVGVAIFRQTFVVKPIDLSDLPGLVVAA